MIVVDTTMLVYATGGDHKLRAPCRELVSAIADGAVAATTTVEVIQEFAYVRARRVPRPQAALLARDFQALLAPLIEVTEEHLTSGLTLWERHNSLGAFDAVLAATAMAGGAGLVSADAGFAAVAGLDHIVPDETGMARLLNT